MRGVEVALTATTTTLVVLATLSLLQLLEYDNHLAKIDDGIQVVGALLGRQDREDDRRLSGGAENLVGLEHGRRKTAEVNSWKQRDFEPHGSYGFVKFSGYRKGETEMVAIGLGALHLWGKRSLQQCWWTPPQGPAINGRMRIIHGQEHHDLQYHVIIIECHLESKAETSDGGFLTMTVDGEDIVVYSEKPGELVENWPTKPLKHNITHCSPPLHDGVYADRVKVWLDYHMRMGFDHFVMYDVGGVTPEMLEMLQPYIDAGIVEITPFHAVTKYPNWYFGQVLIINECLYRHRFTSSWVAFIDYDEYLWVHGNRTLQDILAEFPLVPYIQHGTTLWTTKKCVAAGEDDPRWPMERMIYHQPEPFCRDKNLPKKTCHNYYGHRKYFANPRRVKLVENHRIVEAQAGGVSLSTDVMLHQHLRGLVTVGWGNCTEVYGEDEDVPGFVHDRKLAVAFQELRENPINLGDYVKKRRNWEEHVTASKPRQR